MDGEESFVVWHPSINIVTVMYTVVEAISETKRNETRPDIVLAFPCRALQLTGLTSRQTSLLPLVLALFRGSNYCYGATAGRAKDNGNTARDDPMCPPRARTLAISSTTYTACHDTDPL